MIIEFERGSELGEIFLSGSAVALWSEEEGNQIEGYVKRHSICLREPDGWEKDIFLIPVSRPQFRKGPSLLGEEKTVCIWNEDHPGRVLIETDESEEINKFSRYKWTESLWRMYRPDGMTICYSMPSALFQLQQLLPAR